jgi:hypothetical protein
MGGKYREKFGNDEIKCAVFSADLRGSTRNSGRFDIYDNFDDGDEKTFDPPREVVTLDLAGASGEVQLAFSVLLIESQLTEGDGLQKAWEAFVKIYEDAIKETATKRQMSVEEVRAVAAQPGYLNLTERRFTGVPITEATMAVSPAGSAPAVAIGRTPVFATGAVFATGTAPAAVTGTGGVFVTDTVFATGTGDTGTDPTDPEKKKKEEEERKGVGDIMIGAITLAVALFIVKFAGAAVNALIAWAKDKFFPPVAINVKFNGSTEPETVPANGTGVVEFRGHDGIYEMEWDILVR